MTEQEIALERNLRGLLANLRSQGFALRTEKGQLLVSPVSRLTPEQRAALKTNKAELIALLSWEAEEGPATDAVFRVWFASAENPPPRKIFSMTVEDAQ